MKRVLDAYHRLLKFVMTALLAFMLAPVSFQIASRFTGLVPRYIWTEELARFCFAWIIMIGAIVAVRDDTHFDVDLMPQPKTKREEGVSKLIVHIAMFLMALVFAWYGFEFARFGAKQTSEMSGIGMVFIYVSFPIAGLSWLLFLGEKCLQDIRAIRSVEAEKPA